MTLSASQLAKERCQACRPDGPLVSEQEAQTLLAGLPNWRIVTETVEGAAADVPQLQKAFAFKDYAAALAFVNRVGALANAADHHPRLVLEWGRVQASWWTHTIAGLHRNDFIMAARCEEALAEPTFDDEFPPNPVVEAYKRDVDRSLLRENLKRSVEERVRNLMALQRLAAEARRAGRNAS